MTLIEGQAGSGPEGVLCAKLGDFRCTENEMIKFVF